MKYTLAFVLSLSLTGFAPAQTLYETPFSDSIGWTLTGNWEACKWKIDASPGNISGGAFRSAPTSLNANNTACDDFYNLSTAVSPPVDISTALEPVVSFWCNNNFDSCCESCGNEWRGFSIGNGGATNNLRDLCMSILPDCTLYGQWHEHSFALDPAWGTVQFQFLVENPSVLFSGVPGWFVDDLLVEDIAACPSPTNYCAAVANSTGQRAKIGWQNSASVTSNNFRLSAEKCPPNKPGLFFYGPTQAELLVGDGHLCVTGSTYRLPVVLTGSTGTPSYTMDFTNPPSVSGQIVPGDTWNFSFWFRDPSGGPGGFNFSDGLSVTFCP